MLKIGLLVIALFFSLSLLWSDLGVSVVAFQVANFALLWLLIGHPLESRLSALVFLAQSSAFLAVANSSESFSSRILQGLLLIGVFLSVAALVFFLKRRRIGSGGMR